MKTETQEGLMSVGMARRSFLKYAGAGVASVGLLAAGCHKDHPISPSGTDIGSGDIGILNYAYALEQLEAAFYIQVVLTPYSGISDSEKTLLTDIRDHEVCHREFFKAALGAKAIKGLTPDFSKIDFSSRTAVLGAAKAFEDTGVQAYDGAGYLIQNPDYLTIAGKIVSVEARHAGYIRELVMLNSFADRSVVDIAGLDVMKTPHDVLIAVKPFIKTSIDFSKLPN